MFGRRARICWAGVLLLAAAPVRADGPPAAAPPAGPPEWLPRYNLDVVMDIANLRVRVAEDVTWTNRSAHPVDRIVFNAHAAYRIPDKDAPLLAKMVEILRMAPSEAMSTDGPALTVEHAFVRAVGGTEYPVKQRLDATRLPCFSFDAENQTALIVRLPEPLAPGKSATIHLDCVVNVPPKKGRWGHWDGITTLAQWLPVVAVHDDIKGWQPAPFVPWHQPFHNEAGLYTARVTVPKGHKLAASCAEKRVRDLEGDWKVIELEPTCLRDFALIASSKFEERWGEADGVKVRCLHLPEHEFYGKVLLEAVCEAIPIYNHWFGRYPNPQFTIVESCFGWNGNECGGLVMIDDRMFRMPHIARAYPAYLVQHELCHQWWYNVIGTNGYAETFMDEGPATYFSHRLVDRRSGVNNPLLEYPKGLNWLPNIHRGDLRNYSYLGARARGDIHPTVQPMEKFDHLVNLSATAYDRGSKIIGMLEERLGEAAFFEFMRHLYRTYHFRILRVKDFQAELETWTGHSWHDFFAYWVYGSGMCDWAVESVEVEEAGAGETAIHGQLPGPRRPTAGARTPIPAYKAVVRLKQRAGFNEPTVLGVRLEGDEGYQVRVPIHPDVAVLRLDEPVPVLIEAVTSCNRKNPKDSTAEVRVELTLPRRPAQITVDPDQVLLDDCPTNNHWKAEYRWRLTPLYTQLDETDVSEAYDRWNFIAGPWAFAASFNDPWFVRTAEIGLRAGVYRTQAFCGGVYLGYRADDRNIIAGVDGLWDHVLVPRGQVGFTIEQSVETLGPQDVRSSRGVAFARYVLMYGDSLYLQPFQYVEAFGLYSNRNMPDPRTTLPGSLPFQDRPALGAHYHLNLLTPYWDAEGGLACDLTYQYGLPIVGNDHTFQELYGQMSFVKSMPRLFDWLGSGPVVSWLNDTRWAFRIGGASALPLRGQFFSLGGGDRFRGYDLAERQGSVVWVGSVEWRVPLMRNLDWDYCDHVVGLRNVYLAPFYDVGDAYLQGQSLGAMAHALGVGVRLDLMWLGMIERTMLRFDVAKTLNSSAPWQLWVGVQHPF